MYKAEDYVSAELIYPDNIACSGVWCFTASPGYERDSTEIFGEKGSVKFSTFTFEPIVLINETGRIEFVNERPEHVQYNLIDQVVQTLSGKGKASSTGQSAARTSKVMEEIVKEYYKDKRQ